MMPGVPELAIAFTLDVALGDPAWFPHPIRGVGFMIKHLENPCRKFLRSERWAGVLLVLIVLAFTVALVILTQWLAGLAAPWACSAVTVAWLYFGFSTRCLSDHALCVAHDLEAGMLVEARKSVSHIVGRDTTSLSSIEVSRAAVESVAESTVDGIISPLLFAAIGGAPGLWAFKVASTCDSMIGYKNERYIRFGTFGARLDDVLNYIPARIAFFIFPIAALFAGGSPGRCLRIGLRDHHHHASPNAGIPESCTAGALGIRLGGPTIYAGEVENKEYFGGELQPPSIPDVRRSIHLMWTASLITLVLAIGLTSLRWWLVTRPW